MMKILPCFLLLAAAGCSSTGGGGATTGLILDASGSRGGAAGCAPASWRVVEEGGLEICSSADLSPRHGWKGVFYHGDWAAVRSREAVKWIGRNPVAVRVKGVQWSEDRRSATFVLDAAAAEELRAVPAFRDMVRRADMAVVLGGL
jgi:hypothetical protein